MLSKFRVYGQFPSLVVDKYEECEAVLQSSQFLNLSQVQRWVSLLVCDMYEEEFVGWVFSVRQYTVVHEQFQHKLNYFLFYQNFEKIFTICVKNLIIIIIIKFEIFRLSGLNFRPIISRIEEYDKDNKIIFIILYKYYLPKFSELKNQLSKLRFEIQLIILQFVVKSVWVLW